MRDLLWLLLPVLLLAQCRPSEQRSIPEDKAIEYQAEGKAIVEEAATRLSSQLKQVIADSGLSGAIGYCNIHAMPILDSVSRSHNVTVHRTSLKLRNPANAPDDFEERILNLYGHAAKNEKELKPQVGIDRQNRVSYYHPIMVKGLCLNCHGTKDNGLALETYKTILAKYPKDKAINYSEGDLRGMWVVTFLDTISSGL